MDTLEKMRAGTRCQHRSESSLSIPLWRLFYSSHILCSGVKTWVVFPCFLTGVKLHSLPRTDPRTKCSISSFHKSNVIIQFNRVITGLLCALAPPLRLMTALSAHSLASNSSLRPAAGNLQQPHTEPPLKANESFIMMLLFSLWLLKTVAARSPLVCVCACSENLKRVLNLTCVSECAACMRGYMTRTLTHSHTCFPMTLSASFPERHIKGCVHSRALCSLKCSRAATDPQILTFKPCGGNGEKQTGREGIERETEMER